MAPQFLTPSSPLLLGSGSPRRTDLLNAIGIPYSKWACSVDETVATGDAPDAYLSRIVSDKLTAVLRTAPPEQLRSCLVVLVADTTVVDGGDILGKPPGAEAAAGMLERLSGRRHRVLTRFALATATEELRLLHAETVMTQVVFRRLEKIEMDAYVRGREWVDKAGGYAAQGGAAAFIEVFEGSYTNVVGLPTCALVVALRRLGLIP